MPNTGTSRSRLDWFITYLVTNISVAVFWVFFFVLNRTTVIGRGNVGGQTNTVLFSNHQSMIDSFLVGLCVFFPRSLYRPSFLPWNPAAVENFYKTPLLAWLARHWKCIPVQEGRRDLRALRRMIEVLPKGVMVLFPEGSRTRDGTVGSGRAGSGMLVLSTRPRVIPVAIEGMNRVLPVGSSIPRIFQRVRVHYGPPVDYTDLIQEHRGRESAQAVVDRVMDTVRAQYESLCAQASRKPRGSAPPAGLY